MERNGSVSLRPWTMEDKEDLARLCNGVDRSYVRNSLPFPYTEKDAEWWIGMTLDRDGKDGVFRAVCLDGKVVGNISVEQGTDVYRCGAEIGYMLDRGVWSRGDHDGGSGAHMRRGVEDPGYPPDHRTGLRAKPGIQAGPGKERF